MDKKYTIMKSSIGNIMTMIINKKNGDKMIEDIETMIIGEKIGDNIDKLNSFKEHITANPDILDDWERFRVYENKYLTIKKNLYEILAYSIDPEGGKKYVKPVENAIQAILYIYRPPIFQPLAYREKSGCDSVHNNKEIGFLLLDIEEKRSLGLRNANEALNDGDIQGFIIRIHKLHSTELQEITMHCENLISGNQYAIDLDVIAVFESLYNKMLALHCDYIISRTKKCVTIIEWIIGKIEKNTLKKYDDKYDELILSLSSLVDFFTFSIEEFSPDKEENYPVSSFYIENFSSAKMEFYHMVEKYENL